MGRLFTAAEMATCVLTKGHKSKQQLDQPRLAEVTGMLLTRPSFNVSIVLDYLLTVVKCKYCLYAAINVTLPDIAISRVSVCLSVIRLSITTCEPVEP